MSRHHDVSIVYLVSSKDANMPVWLSFVYTCVAGLVLAIVASTSSAQFAEIRGTRPPKAMVKDA